MTRPVFRFAPSPNGLLHLGHALSALVNAERAEETGGRLLLRIEDIDQTRCRPEFEAAVLDDLAWLGIRYEAPIRRQSEHFDDYRAALGRLDEMGLVYPAFLSRGEMKIHAADPAWPRDPDGAPLYSGADRDLGPSEAADRIASGAPYALRLKMDEAVRRAGPLDWAERGEGRIVANPTRWGDVVLARKDVPTSYHLSVVVDDALQGITDVVRGRDLYHATSVHRLLQTLLGLPEPAYEHHRLILGLDGRKLSKSEGASGIAALRESGATPADIRRMVGLDQPAPRK